MLDALLSFAGGDDDWYDDGEQDDDTDDGDEHVHLRVLLAIVPLHLARGLVEAARAHAQKVFSSEHLPMVKRRQ